MSLSPFTTPEDVMAVCGISSDELGDGQLDLMIYELALDKELRDVAPGLPDDFKAFLASPTPTSQQVGVVKAVQMFATYAVAMELTTALPLLAPKDISDGKATTARFADAPYKAVIAKIEAAYGKAKNTLEAALAELGGTTAPAVRIPTMLAKSSPTYDPVLGS